MTSRTGAARAMLELPPLGTPARTKKPSAPAGAGWLNRRAFHGFRVGGLGRAGAAPVATGRRPVGAGAVGGAFPGVALGDSLHPRLRTITPSA